MGHDAVPALAAQPKRKASSVQKFENAIVLAPARGHPAADSGREKATRCKHCRTRVHGRVEHQIHPSRTSEPISVDYGRSEDLVAEWIHFTLFGIMLPPIKLKVYTFWGL